VPRRLPRCYRACHARGLRLPPGPVTRRSSSGSLHGFCLLFSASF
jgi:hypothetical protein